MRAVHGFAETATAARRLAARLAIPYCEIEVRSFPDGESLVRVAPPAAAVILFRSLDRPNDKLVEVLLAASALRDSGAAQITLVAPYMGYMRQDAAFNPGEAVSQRVIGRLIGGAVDRVVTVNPHLHRTTSLDAVFPGIPAAGIDAAPAFAELLLAEGVPAGTVVLGPDEESRPWVMALAARLGAEGATARKFREGDARVTLTLPEALDLAGRTVLLLDDVVSTGTTLARCAEAVRRRGAARVDALVVHALHDDATARRLAAAGIDRVISSDSVPHHSNGVTLAPLLADALGEVRGSGR